jgi:hypothetical protein
MSEPKVNLTYREMKELFYREDSYAQPYMYERVRVGIIPKYRSKAISPKKVQLN